MAVLQLTRFRLRSLLVVVSIMGLLFAWIHDHRRQVRNTQDAIDASAQHFGSANVRAAIIDHSAARAGISLSDNDVEREVRQTSARFGLDVDRWYRLIEKEAGLTPSDYRGEVIRPALQLRELRKRNPTVFKRLSAAIESRFPDLRPLPVE